MTSGMPAKPRTPLLAVFTFATTAALAGCATESKPAQPAARAGEPTTEAAPADRTAARDRGDNRPVLPRHLGDRTATAPDPADLAARRADRMARREEAMARRAERRQEMLEKFDADHDGELSDAERAAVHQSRVVELVARVDTDGDGKLSAAEVEAMPMRGRRGGPDFATLDADGDGFVDAEELAAARPPRFRGGRGDRPLPPPPGGEEPAPAK